jgi:hypothetical protein
MRLSVTVLLAIACALGMGCRKKAAPAASATESVAATNAVAEGEGGPVAPPEPPQPPPREVLARADDQSRQAVVGDVDPFLTAELQKFIQQKNRMPASFSEFARARLDSVPRPPAGKRWVIDAASLEVKAVAQ